MSGEVMRKKAAAVAVSLSGALHRFPDANIPAIAQDVTAAANAISRKFGYAEV
jgi:DNA-binding IclR family transcriptional regulator